MNIIEHLESDVRSYCRNWPTTFATARGARLWDERDREYLDFFAGAGVLNYGHNHPAMREALIDYLRSDGVVHGLDMVTQAKRTFLQRFKEVILDPRGLDYKVQFPGPTGTNAVEAALKLARNHTGRERIVGFTNAFHGMTLGALSLSGNQTKRAGAGMTLSNAVSMPYDDYLDDGGDSIAYLEQFLADEGSGLDKPAAIITETIQAEGGLYKASMEWLRRLQEVCRRHGAFFIVDDIQAGVGRTGPFFSFEPAGVEPDVVCLSKSLSGFGLPLAVTLIRRDLDSWDPGGHDGTFRGHNPAFVTATEALSLFWESDELSRQVEAKAELVTEALDGLVELYPELGGEVRGRGLLQGIACQDPEVVDQITTTAFERGLLMETSGVDSEVLKLLPPLTITEEELRSGIGILERSIAAVLGTAVRSEAAPAGAGK